MAMCTAGAVDTYEWNTWRYASGSSTGLTRTNPAMSRGRLPIGPSFLGYPVGGLTTDLSRHSPTATCWTELLQESLRGIRAGEAGRRSQFPAWWALERRMRPAAI